MEQSFGVSCCCSYYFVAHTPLPKRLDAALYIQSMYVYWGEAAPRRNQNP
jgi:hypothetical protein